MVDFLLLPYFGFTGSNILSGFLVLIGVLLTTDLLILQVFGVGGKMVRGVARGNAAMYEGARGLAANFRTRAEDSPFELPEAEEEFEEAAPPEPLVRPAVNIRVQQRELEFREPLPEPPKQADLAIDDTPPFDAVPGMDDGAADEAPFDEPVQEAYEQAQEPDYEEPDFQDDFVADEPDEEPYAAPEPPARAARAASGLIGSAAGEMSQKRATRAVRKNLEIDEVPADFKYPKRYSKPPISILEEPSPTIIPNLREQLQETSVVLEETLQTFNIEARVTDVTRGPTITRFELEPAPGIKVSRFLALADDIALALKAHRVRVEAPIPGKGRVGIEVPNVERDAVLIRELLESKVFQKGSGKLKLGLGKDIAGDVQIADLAGMPHLLVAGATGAGKTVCVKALLASLLFTHTPDELQLILIDPKMVELSVFNDIPHLITPVVVDPKKASTALQWLIKEMEERYKLFAELRVRNIEVYNKSVDNGEIALEGGDDDHAHVDAIRKLPYIVCVVDELADLMMLARSEVEDSIARLAQLARAVGIHLIIATQRPSVDVLTGVIKANFPARVSFQVSSRVDSRCILDEIGAEKLIGMGDLLYLPAGQSKPMRIQGAFVSDEEMFALIAHLKRQAPPQYRDEIANYGKNTEKLAELDAEDDPLFDEAVQVVLETGQASISMVQRRLRVGYTRAARLIDMMELRGIVGPHEGSKAREILVDAASSREDVA
ncbi:MAG: DNA translocase FtsK [Candidatus Hydrogenedens sp.]|nr:DNA translocase FtsK [Candidatus Hydrogenedens sp.]